MNSDAIQTLVSERIEQNIVVSRSLLQDARYLATVAEAGMALVHCLQSGHKVLFFGNGGSAADAQHLAAELTGRFLKDRPPLPGMALTTNTSALSAIGNDYSFDQVFARQLQGLGSEGDVAFGISTSGNARNVLCAMEMARQKKLLRVALTGSTGGKLANAVDHCIRVPSETTPRIQEAHILTGHILCEIVERELFE